MSRSEPVQSPPTDLRLVPLAAAAWLGTAAALAQNWTLLAGCALTCLGLLGIWLVRRHWLVLGTALALGLCLAAGGARVSLTGRDQVAELAGARAVVELVGVVASEPQVTPRRGVLPEVWSARLRLERIAGRGQDWASGQQVLVTASSNLSAWREVATGTRLVLTARLGAPDSPTQLLALARAREPPRVLAEPGPLDRAVNFTRGALRRAVGGLPDEQRQLVPGLVLGDTSAMTPELAEDFQATGLTHLTAVSGANLTLLVVFVQALARACGLRGRVLRTVAVVVSVGFVLLCRSEPSILRAAAMGLVGIAALGQGRSLALRNLCVATLALLLIDPWLALSAGFALSVLASAGIVWWSRSWADRLSSWAPRWLAEAISVPLAAQTATAPVVAAISGTVSVVGLAANALAEPLVGPATILGFVCAGLAALWLPLGTIAAFPAGWVAQVICWIARAGARTPGAQLSWPASPLAIGLLCAGCMGFGLVAPRLLGRRGPALVCVLVLVVTLLRPPIQPGWPPRDWSIVACDVGQGDAFVVHTGEGRGVVVDAGPDPRAVDRCLSILGIAEVTVLVLTHFHDDHIAGLPGVLNGRRVGLALLNPLRSPLPGANRVARLLEDARQQGRLVGVVSAQSGQTITAAGATLSVLAAVAPGRTGPEGLAEEGESSAENDSSIAVRVDLSGLRMLFAGDREVAGQAELAALGDAVRADVIAVPHHGSGRHDPAFLAATRARLALISVGADNSYGHPAPRTLRTLTSLRIGVARTDRDGGVGLSGPADRLVLTVQR